MSDSQDHPPREKAIDPPPGPHAAPMPQHPIGTTEVRQGETSGRMRWVLGGSLLLVVVVLFLVFALSG